MELDRRDIPHGWYDLVVVGHGWEAIGAAWYARRLGARVAIVPGADTAGACLKVPWPLCQWWNLGRPSCSNSVPKAGSSVCWQPPDPPFVEGMPMGGQTLQVLPADKALGQLAASGVAVFRGPVCFQAPDVLEVQGHPVPFRKLLLAMGQQEEKISLPGAEPAQITTPEQLLDQLGFSVAAGSGPGVVWTAASQPSGGSSEVSARAGGVDQTVPSPPGKPERERKALAHRVAILGHGSEECSWAQWLARRGCQVHLLTPEPTILPDHEPEIRQWVQTCLLQEGVRIHLHTVCRHVEPIGQAKLLLLEQRGQQEKLLVDFFSALPARRVVDGGLQMDLAGLDWDPTGIPIDAGCRSRNRRIFAAGSVCGCQFRCARIAWSMLQWAVAKALGHRPPNRDWHLRFQCIPIDPPIFWLGQTPAEAEQQCWSVRSYRVEDAASIAGQATSARVSDYSGGMALQPNRAANHPKAFLHIHLRRRTGRILGAVVAGPWAHELADLIAFLIQQKISLCQWAVPTGCASPAMGLLEEAARLARQDHPAHWWDPPLESLSRLWQKWKNRFSESTEHLSPNRGCFGQPE